MKFHKTENTYVIKITKGEDVIASITEFCEQEGNQNAHFSGIGAVEYVKCGYYDLEKREYFFKEYDEIIYEVISMTGNVMLKEGKPFVHVHGTFSDHDNAVFGGHIGEMRVGVTLEIILTPLASTLERQHDDNIGLYLICP